MRFVSLERREGLPLSRRSVRLFSAVLLGTTALVGASRAIASDLWLGTSTDWYSTSNWSRGAVPSASDQVVIDLGSGVPATRITGGNASSQTIDVGVTSTTQSTLQITGGGILTSSGDGNIGDNIGANGMVLVDGASSSWALGSNDLNVGRFGDGDLTVTNNGTVSDLLGVIGLQAGGTGLVSVNSGGTWTNSLSLTVGNSGTATLNIQSGGRVMTSPINGLVIIGFNAGSNGTVTVDGNTSTLVGNQIDVGVSGTGTLTITNGGGALSSSGIVGDGAGGSGTVNISGTNAVWTNNNLLTIGNAGHGVVNLTNGGQLNTGSIAIGAQAGNTAANTLSVNNGTVTASAITVGSQGVGNLVLLNGGTVSASSLIIGAQAGANGRVDVSAGGSLGISTIVVGLNGTGLLQVSGGAGAPPAGSVTLAQNAGSTGQLVIGGIGTALAAGTFSASSLTMGAGTAEIDFNHTSSNYTFLTPISGTGTIKQFAGVTDLTGNSSAFTGTTIISGGTLSVNGTLGGVVTINGGALGGNGTVGNVTVASGGSIAPGNSIGTLNVGSISFSAGSTYVVQLDGGGNTAGVDNDLINSTSTATISGGTVHVTPVNGTDDGSTYTPNTTYRIITAASGVSGTFSGVTDDYPFLNFSLSYDANNVYLTSFIPPAVTSFCLSGMTANQCHTGNAAFSVGSGGLFNALANLSGGAVPAALDQLSGEIHASARTVLIDDSRFGRDAVMNRLRTAFGGVDAGHIELAEKKIDDRNFTFWGQAFGSWGDWDGGNNAGKLDRSLAGFFLGGDGLVTEDVRLGVFGGYSNASLDESDRQASGTAQTVTLGTYGGAQWGALGLRFGASYGWSNLSTDRDIAFSGFADSPSANYHARLAQVFGEAGYKVNAGPVNLEPFANLAYVNLSTDGFKEHGGAAALKVAGRTADSVFTTLGVRAEYKVTLANMPINLRGMIGWRHAFADVTPTSGQAFASGGSSFQVTGVPIARNALALDTGFAISPTPGASLGLSYGGQFAAGSVDQSVKANFALQF